MPHDHALTITHVSTQRGWHGGEEQARQLILGLCQRGHRCVIHARADGVFAQRMREEGFAVQTFTGRGRTPWALLRLRRQFRKDNPDVIHFHDSHALTCGGIAAWKLGMRARVASRRVDLPVRSPWVYRNLCDRVIAVSQAVADICRSHGVPDDALRVVHDGVDPTRASGGDRKRGRQSINAGDEDFIVLTIATLNEHKGHRFLLQAMPEILRCAPKVRLVLAGDGKQRGHFEQMAAELGVIGSVDFLGYRTDIPDLLKAADLFVLPSQLEGLGSSLLDVMFARVPMITTTAGGIPEVVGCDSSGHTSAAIVVPPRDAPALALAIVQAHESAALRAELVDRAEQRAMEMFTADRMVERTLAVYHELLEK